jgi:sodium/pantothenate symporter
VAEVLSPISADILIAVVIGAGLTTIDSMLLVVSSNFVKNIVMAFKPDMKPEASKRLSYITIGAVTIIIIYLALYPPAFLEWVILYAIGGLIAVYFASLLWGLYWRRANKYGALASMIGGIPACIISYLHGIHPVIPAFIVSNR